MYSQWYSSGIKYFEDINDNAAKSLYTFRWLRELEDLKVLKRSPDLLINVKIGQGQLRLIIQTYFVLPYMGSCHLDQVT